MATIIAPSYVEPTPVIGRAVVIPLAATPAQTVAVALGDQSCRIDVSQRLTGLYLDLYVADVLVVAGVLCLDRNALVREQYRGFVGELLFSDSQGTSDPTYDGLADRYRLLWIAPL